MKLPITEVVTLAFALLLTPVLRADVVLGGAVSYSPPIPMFGGDEAGNAGLPIDGTEYRTEGGTNGYAQVNFQLMSILAIFPRPSQPPAEIRSIADLKGYLDTSLKGRTNLLNVSTSTGKFSGREAVTCKAQMLTGPCKWYQSTYLFWEKNPQWLRSSLFHVFVVAEKKETFDKLVKSLEGARIKSGGK